MYNHQMTYRIPYPEVDRLNVVHHAHYAKYYEMGRVEAFRALGWSYKNMEDGGIGLFVVEIESKFLKPVTYDEVIEIHTNIPEMPGRRIEFHNEIWNDKREICNIAKVKLLFVDRSRMKVCSMPDNLKLLLLPYFKS